MSGIRGGAIMAVGAYILTLAGTKLADYMGVVP
jgi:hypothetical protein